MNAQFFVECLFIFYTVSTLLITSFYLGTFMLKANVLLYVYPTVKSLHQDGAY